MGASAGTGLRSRRSPRPAWLLAVLAGHGLLFWMISLMAPSPARTGTTARVDIRLLPLTATAVEARMDAAPPQPRPPEPPRGRTLRERAKPPTAAATVLPLAPLTAPLAAPPGSLAPPSAAAAPPAAPATPPAPAPPPAADTTAARPLDLRLPPSASRSASAPRSMAQEAVAQQIGGRPALSAEARLSRRLETTWTEENLGDGRIRLRRGDECVILSETRGSQLDPWNRAGPPPRGAGPCP